MQYRRSSVERVLEGPLDWLSAHLVVYAVDIHLHWEITSMSQGLVTVWRPYRISAVLLVAKFWTLPILFRSWYHV